MTNAHTMKEAASAVLQTLHCHTDDAYVNEVGLELELIEQGFMGPEDSIVAMEAWDDPRFISVVLDRESRHHFIIDADTGIVTICED